MFSYHHVVAQSPKIDWSTYYGGQLTSVNSVVYDNERSCIYILGYTADTSGIATPGAHKSSSTFNSMFPAGGEYLLDLWNSDIFLSKFDLHGNRIWSTYFGGNGIENFPSMCLDHDGNIIIAGGTSSHESIATIGTFRSNTPVDSGEYGFVAKFNPDGEQLWGTYMHADVYNPSFERKPMFKLAVDRYNNIYLSGPILFGNDYATPGAYQESITESEGEFIMKLNSSGQRVWGTFYNDVREIYDIVISDNDKLYITGVTDKNLPGTPGVYQPYNLSTTYSTAGFISAFDLSGSRIWHTYVSTPEYTDSINRAGITPFSISVDTFDHIYIYGQILEVDSMIATAGVFQESFNGDPMNRIDLFLMKFDSTGNKVWGTYYGGSTSEDIVSTHYQFGAQKINVTKDGQSIYISGGFLSENSGNNVEWGCSEIDVSSKTGFVARFNSNGQAVWSTYYNERVMDIAIAASKNEDTLMNHDIYFVSRTDKDGLATAGSHKDNKIGLVYSGLIGKIIEMCPNFTPRLSYTYPDLSVDTSYESYTWYHNGVEVSSGDSDTYAPGVDTTGFYYAVVQKCGCTYTTDTFYFDDMGISNQDFAQHFQLFPNPTEHSVQLRVLNPNLSIKETDIYVYNLLGQSQAIKITQLGTQQYQIDLKGLPAGTYQIQLRNQKGQWSQKVVKW